MVKKVLVVFILIILAAALNAQETIFNGSSYKTEVLKTPRFSFQSKPLLYVVPVALKITSERTGAENGMGIPVILDLEFKYLLNKKINLFINPVFASGFWSYASIDGDNMVFMDYYLSNCLDFVTGIMYRPFETGLQGLYFGVFSVIGWGFVTYASDGRSSETEKIADFLNLGFITEVGYEWIFKNGFTIALGIGISKLDQIPKVSIITAVNSPIIGNDMYHYGSIHGQHFWKLPVDPRIKFSIGYSF